MTPKKRQKEKTKTKTWIPTSSSPRQSLSRGPQYLKACGFPTTNLGNDGGGRCLAKSQAWRKRNSLWVFLLACDGQKLLKLVYHSIKWRLLLTPFIVTGISF